MVTAPRSTCPRWAAYVPHALLGIVLTGCLPYGYPTAAFVPPVRPACDPREVRAFRVDTTWYKGDLVIPPNARGAVERVLLTPIPLSADGTWPQARVSIDHGIAVVTPPLTYTTRRSRTVSVWLYRPGFESVEVKEGEGADAVTWKPAADAAAQEKALDGLFDPDVLAPGSTTDGHRQALLVGAAEYERLGFAAKADKLRKLAAE